MWFSFVFVKRTTKFKKVQKNKRKTIDRTKEICYSLHRKISEFTVLFLKLVKFNKKQHCFCSHQQTKTTFSRLFVTSLYKKTTFFQKNTIRKG